MKPSEKLDQEAADQKQAEAQENIDRENKFKPRIFKGTHWNAWI